MVGVERACDGRAWEIRFESKSVRAVGWLVDCNYWVIFLLKECMGYLRGWGILSSYIYWKFALTKFKAGQEYEKIKRRLQELLKYDLIDTHSNVIQSRLKSLRTNKE